MFVTKRLHTISRLTRCVTRNVLLKNTPYIGSKHNSVSLLQVNFLSSSHNLKNAANSQEENETNECSVEQSKYNTDAVTKGDAELEHKLKVIKLEIEVLRQQGKLVPSDDYITNEMWENLLNLQSRSARMKYLVYLFKLSKTQEHRRQKKLEKQKELEEVQNNRTSMRQHSSEITIEDHALEYGLSRNSIFFRIKETTMNHLYNSKLVQAMQFGQKLVVDCGYDQHMTERENGYTAKQLMFLFSENRVHADPFDVHFTNINKESGMIKTLNKFIPTLYDREFPINLTESSYLDLFPKDQLIYLTPHCREEMTTFDKNAIYIIGAIVDKVNHEPISLAKAKRDKLKMMKFPLDRYLQWSGGSGKSLTLNQCISILLDVRRTGDWNYALRHVPRRKLADLSDTQNNNNRIPRWQAARKERTWKPIQNRVQNTKTGIKSIYDDE